MTQTAFAMTSPLRSRWDQEGAEFVQSNSDWCARACARLLTLNSQLQAADALQLVQEWSLKDGLRALSPELAAEDAARTRRGKRRSTNPPEASEVHEEPELTPAQRTHSAS